MQTVIQVVADRQFHPQRQKGAVFDEGLDCADQLGKGTLGDGVEVCFHGVRAAVERIGKGKETTEAEARCVVLGAQCTVAASERVELGAALRGGAQRAHGAIGACCEVIAASERNGGRRLVVSVAVRWADASKGQGSFLV